MMGDLELRGSRPPSVTTRLEGRPRSGFKLFSDSVEMFPTHAPKEEQSVNFKPSWAATPRNKTDKLFRKSKMRPLLWAPEDRASNTSQSERRSTHTIVNKGSQSIDFDKYRPVKQKASFVDESLFGPHLQEPSFEAPWAEKTKKTKPFLFSPVDYAKLTREGSTMSAKYSSSGTLDGRPPSRQGRRPKTASTRPVTVEGTQDLDKTMGWRP